MKTHEEIFQNYLDDKCPACEKHVDSESYTEHRTRGGKTIAYEFECSHCGSHYTIGMNRSLYPILSEITFDNFNKSTKSVVVKNAKRTKIHQE